MHSYYVPMTDFTQERSQPNATSIEKIKQFARECTKLATIHSDSSLILTQLVATQHNCC